MQVQCFPATDSSRSVGNPRFSKALPVPHLVSLKIREKWLGAECRELGLP